MRPTVEQIRNLGDFSTLYNWSLTVVKSPSGVSGLDEGLNLRCVSSEVPKSINTPIDVQIRGHHIQQDGLSDASHSLTLTFMETVDNYISNAIKQWRDVTYDIETGIAAPKSEVEADILLQRMDRQDNIIWTYKIIGCGLSDYDPTGGELQGESELVKPTITLRYDTFKDGPGSTV